MRSVKGGFSFFKKKSKSQKIRNAIRNKFQKKKTMSNRMNNFATKSKKKCII